MSLEDAAEKVGVSKKSLDDYLSQLRQGRTVGFDFNMHKHEKVGYLRQFVKENSKIIKGVRRGLPVLTLGKRKSSRLSYNGSKRIRN